MPVGNNPNNLRWVRRDLKPSDLYFTDSNGRYNFLKRPR